MTPAVLLAMLHLRGVRIRANGDALSLKPAERLTPDLIAHLTAHKGDLLAILRAARDLTDPKAGGALDAPTAYIARTPARQPVIDLLAPIHRTDLDRGIFLRDRWAERLAIAVCDPDCADQAEAVALADLQFSI